MLKQLADEAAVPYDAHYNVTTVDPPELLQYLHTYHSDVIWDRPQRTMWQLIVQNGMPPTRTARYCCRELKERGGIGRIVALGIRWAESQQRSGRQMIEVCHKTGRSLVNPIIDWSDKDVWEFIRDRDLPYCSLYDEGWKRIGCVMCPLSGPAQQRRDAIRWPRYYQMYLRAFTKMLERREERGRSGSWKTAEDVMNWWIPKQTWPLEIHELPHNEAGYWSKGYHTEEEFTAAYPVQIVQEFWGSLPYGGFCKRQEGGRGVFPVTVWRRI